MDPVLGTGVAIAYGLYRLFSNSDDDKKDEKVEQEKPEEKVCTCKVKCTCED